MSLIDDAIQAYAKDQLKNKEGEEKEKKKFIEDCIQDIKDKFGDNLKIEVTSVKEDGVAFLVDELKMRLRKYQCHYNIFLVQKCPKCDTEYESRTVNLRDIGKAIQEGHNTYDCENILKNKEPVKELTAGERLIEALKTFIHENSPEC